jgi:hypothetical protein
MNRSLLLTVLALCACSAAPDPVHTRCVTERTTYCKRLFACVQLGGLIGVTVNFENEGQCTTSESKRCDTVTESNPCPGGSASSYSSAKQEQCIKDQDTQSCSAFANRPSSCSSYCCSGTDGGC